MSLYRAAYLASRGHYGEDRLRTNDTENLRRFVRDLFAENDVVVYEDGQRLLDCALNLLTEQQPTVSFPRLSDLAVTFKHMAAVTPRQRGWSHPYLIDACQFDECAQAAWRGSGSIVWAEIKNPHTNTGEWEARVTIESSHVEGVRTRCRVETATDTDRQRLARWMVKIVHRAFSTSPYLE